jgi:hypothetical protein
MELKTGNQGIGILDLSHLPGTRTKDASRHRDLPPLGINGRIEIGLTKGHEASFCAIGEKGFFIVIQRLVQHFQQRPFLKNLGA